MNIFFSSGVSWSQRLSRSSGHGVIFASCGITPSRLWLAKMVSRSPFQPLSNKMHVADLLDRLRRRVIWRVHTARHVVDEKWLVRVDSGDAPHVLDRIVGHRGGQVPAGVVVVGVNCSGVAEQIWLPLIGVPADEAVEIVKA